MKKKLISSLLFCAVILSACGENSSQSAQAEIIASNESAATVEAETVDQRTAYPGKIEDLGENTNELYCALIDIQTAFDNIRNVTSEKKLKFEELKKIRIN